MLYDYQIKAVQDVRDSLAKNKRTILCMPTGSGKTFTATTIVKAAVEKGTRVMWVAHRSELLAQACSTFEKSGIKNPENKIISIQKWSKRRHSIPPPKLIIIDEAHLSMAQTYVDMVNMYPDAYVIGLTATPYRLDNKGLGDIYNDIVTTIPTYTLISMGKLAKPLYRIPENIDFSGISKIGSDFNPKQISSLWNKSKIFAGVVKNFKKICPSAKAIAFSANVEQSKKLVQEFMTNGYTAAHVDADTPEKERQRILELFKIGAIQILCNVALFTEGYDLPSIDCVILNRATLSRALYMQMVGRGSRVTPTKSTFYVLDFGGNVMRHGLWESEVKFSLSGTPPPGEAGIAPLKICHDCFSPMPVQAKKCPNCNADMTKPKADAQEINLVALEDLPEISEKMQILNSETSSMHPYAVAHRLSRITSSPREYRDSLSEIAELRGYSPGWVWRTMNQIKWQGGDNDNIDVN